MHKSKVCIYLILAFIFLAGCENDENPLKYYDVSAFPFGKAMSEVSSYLVLKPDGTLWSWGRNMCGELGHGNTDSLSIPTRINTINNIIDLDIYGGMCVAADAEGRVWFWGNHMASSWAMRPVLSPMPISYLPLARQVYCSGYMIRADGTLWKLGIDPRVDSVVCTQAIETGMTGIKSISGSLALRNDGTILELTPSRNPDIGGYVPVQDVVEVQNSITHSLVLKSDSIVWAWGQNNSGELGNGTWEQSIEPVQIPTLTKVIHISTNYHFNLALTSDGYVWFWGFTGTRDENNNPIGINVPVRVDNLDHVVYIYANFDCVIIKDDGSYWTFKVDDRIVRQLDL